MSLHQTTLRSATPFRIPDNTTTYSSSESGQSTRGRLNAEVSATAGGCLTARLLSSLLVVVAGAGVASADAEVQAEAAGGLSTLTLLGDGEREDDSDRLIVVGGVGDHGPTRGGGGGRTRRELFGFVVVVFRLGGGGRARNDRGTPEQLVSGRNDPACFLWSYLLYRSLLLLRASRRN